MASAPLRVWVLSDGQPGHYNQSRGIVSALQRLQPVETAWLDVRLRLGLLRVPLRRRLNRAPRPATLRPLRAGYRMGALPQGNCDLLVSAGGKTSFANAWLAAVLDVPNIYAGSLRGLDAALFDVVLTLEPVPGAAGNVVLPLPPSPVTPEVVAQKGRGLRERLGGGEQRYWTLMLGGNGAGFRYRRRDWLELASLMKRLAVHYGVRWLVASSRRTGRCAERVLRAALDPHIVARGCWYGDRDSCDTEALLGAAQRVFVTEDSMTMLTEAVCSMRPVYSLRPAQASPNARYTAALTRFEQQGLVCRHSLAGLSRSPQSLEDTACRVLEVSPLVPLAQRLAQRLGLPRASG